MAMGDGRLRRIKPQAKLEAKELDFSLIDGMGEGEVEWEARRRKAGVGGVEEERKVAIGGIIEKGGVWGRRAILSHIARCADAELVSRDGLLAAAVSLTLCVIPPEVIFPDLAGGRNGGERSANFYCALCGKSGTGKGRTVSIAREILTGLDEVPDAGEGTGQGVVTLFKRKIIDEITKKEKWDWYRKAVLLDIAEVDSYVSYLAAKDSISSSVYRKMWDGSRISFAIKGGEDGYYLDPFTYRICKIIGVQPKQARALLGMEGGGLPQRFYWADLTRKLRLGHIKADGVSDGVGDGRVEQVVFNEEGELVRVGNAAAVVGVWEWLNPFSGGVEKWAKKLEELGIKGNKAGFVIPIAEEVKWAMIVDNVRRDSGGEGAIAIAVDDMDSHSGLVRLKLALCFALWDGRVMVSWEDWVLAGEFMERSSKCRDDIRKTLKSAAEAEAKVRGAVRNREKLGEEEDRLVVEEEQKKGCRRMLIQGNIKLAERAEEVKLGPMEERSDDVLREVIGGSSWVPWWKVKNKVTAGLLRDRWAEACRAELVSEGRMAEKLVGKALWVRIPGGRRDGWIR